MLDVAGGKGELAWELLNLNLAPAAVLDGWAGAPETRGFGGRTPVCVKALDGSPIQLNLAVLT